MEQEYLTKPGNICKILFELSTEDMWMLSCMPQETWQGEHPDFAVPKKASNPLQ